MKTVQMTLDEELLSKVDRTVQQLGTTRSRFTREALRRAVALQEELKLERRHREGYARYPINAEEDGVWEAEQVWTDE